MERWSTQPRRYAAREGEPSQSFRFAFLVSEAARLRHGQGAALSRPGLQLGRVGCSPGFTEPTLALRALTPAQFTGSTLETSWLARQDETRVSDLANGAASTNQSQLDGGVLRKSNLQVTL